MTALMEFIASPKNFLYRGPFLLDDPINARVPGANALRLRFGIEKKDHYQQGANRPANAKPSVTSYTVVDLDVPGGAAQGGREAFYLPWKNNLVTAMVLNGTRSFFFTAELSGCIFAVSRRPAQENRPTVVHIGADRIQTKNAVLTQHFGAQWADRCHVYDSAADMAATAMGYLSPKGWVFLIQERAVGFRPVFIRPGKGPAGAVIGQKDYNIPGQMRDVAVYYTFDV